MQQRLADYVADFLVENGITDCFMVTGGGAMHLNDALGHKQGLRCTYNHHEQACAIAAESYARIDNRIAAVCVTTGPGGTNAITGVVGGWLDSIPMLIISGQVRYDTTARGMGLPVRSGGDQEFDITRAVSCMTKYCTMIEDPDDIRYALEKALFLARAGRPGPCWIDIPLNFQAAMVDPDELGGFDAEYELGVLRRMYADGKLAGADRLEGEVDRMLAAAASPAEFEQTLVAAGYTDADWSDVKAGAREAAAMVAVAERPVLYSGAGVRWSGAYPEFQQLVRRLNIPVVCGWDNIDMMADDDPLYVGRAGIMGDRPGNWAVQNADVVLAIGSRLSIRQVGYNWTTWARNAKVIMVDVDAHELEKPTLHVDLGIQSDAFVFMNALMEALDERMGISDTHGGAPSSGHCMPSAQNDEPANGGASCLSGDYESAGEGISSSGILSGGREATEAEESPAAIGLSPALFFPENGWQERCRTWKRDYPVILQRHWDDTRLTNVYAFIDALSSRLPEGYTTVVGNGSACVVGSHGYHIKRGSRFIINSAIASMGYDLPAAVGVCRALGVQLTEQEAENSDPLTAHGVHGGEWSGGREIVCISGDGSIQMNLQELQTILTNKLPIKVFVINNAGYHSIRQTQNNLFSEHSHIGIGPESGDLEFPQMEKLAAAYGYPYFACKSNDELAGFLDAVFSQPGAVLAEVFVSHEQAFEPKSATKRLEDGRLYSPPLEDLAPFLPREELADLMVVPLLSE